MPAQLKFREITLDRALADDARRTVPASLSSEEPVSRYGEIEVLRHTPEAVNLTRAAGGLPLLFSHDRAAPIGIVENVRIEARRLVGTLRFGQSAKATEVWGDVRDGILRHLSISYAIDASEPIKGGQEATRWSVYEASVVAVPADTTVGIGRSSPTQNFTGDNTMPELQTRDAEIAEIRETATRHRLEASFTESLVTRNLSRADAFRAIVEELAQRDRAAGGHLNIPSYVNYPLSVAFGNSPPTEQRELMIDALAARMGGPALKRENPYRHARVTDLARDCLELRGVRTTTMSPNGLVERALHTTSDFPELLTGAGQRVLGTAYGSYEGGIKRACRASTAIDFRAKQRLMLSEAPTLLQVNEHGEFKYGSMSETKTSYALATYGRIFGITRQALVNDELEAFGSVAARLGRASAEFEAKFLVTLLTSNPTMSDSVALFHATHGNLGTGAGSALQLSALTTARAAMRLQKGLDGATPIDATPKYLIVPAALETTAEQLLTSITAAETTNVNPFAGKLELVVDPRLDSLSATAWYLAADPGAIDTLEYSYLDGVNGPEVITREGFEIDGVEMKVRLDFGAGVLDWRGLYKSAGA